jgi:hypothetical protein
MVLNPKSSQSLVNWRQSTVISRQSAVRSSSNADYRLTTPIPVPSRTSGTVESTVVSRLSTLEPRLSTLDYFFNKSLISVRSFSSADGSGGAAGAAGAASSFFFSLFIPLITMKMAKAMMRKSTAVWMKLP